MIAIVFVSMKNGKIRNRLSFKWMVVEMAQLRILSIEIICSDCLTLTVHYAMHADERHGA